MAACTESFCYQMPVSLAPPEFPPPPPLPDFIAQLLKVDNVTDTCDLCSKWGDNSILSAGQSGSDSFTFILAIVAIVSALSGAAIMASILSIRRLRKYKYQNTDSMRHLERKCNEHQSLPLPPTRSSNSTPMSNTYCEGPYNDKVEYPSNIYAELHTTPTSDIWRRPRPPIPTPIVDNCYLELRDLGGPGCPAPISCPHSPTYSLSPSTATSYYTDLEIKNSEIR